jgi:hypothetical protein
MNEMKDIVVDENRSNDGRSLFSPLKHKESCFNNRRMAVSCIEAPNENGKHGFLAL